jgi:hypothetical protein
LPTGCRGVFPGDHPETSSRVYKEIDMQNDIVVDALCAEISRLRDVVKMLEEALDSRSQLISALDERLAQMKTPRKTPAKRGPGRPKKSWAGKT